METDKKTCNMCKEEKTIDNFFRRKDMKDGRGAVCKPCHIARERQWRTNNKEKVKKYTSTDSVKTKKREWEEKNKEKRRERRKQLRQTDSGKQREINRKGKLQYRVAASVSNGIRRAIRANKANRHWEELVGYTLLELMEHLERLFTSEMNWDNYGSYWHIDHIKPQSWFIYDSTESEAFKACWALSNLQPLEASKNCSKRNLYEG